MTTSHNWTYKDATRFQAWNSRGVQDLDSTSQQNAREDVLSKPVGPVGDFKTPNSYAMSASYVEAPKGIQIQTNADRSRWTQEGIIGSIPPIRRLLELPTGTYETVYNEALDRLNEKVRGSLDLSVDAAQISQTVRMFNVLRSVRSITRGLHRSDGIWNGTRRTDPRVVLTLPSGVYLQWKYGWQPLMSSVFGVANELLRQSEDTGIVVRARSKRDEELSPIPDVQLFNSTLSTVIPKGKRQSRCEMKVWLRAPTGTTNLARFTSLDPASIAYELVPYSFVLDMFADIGGYLRNAETALLYNRIFRMGYISYSTKVECEYALAGPTQFSNRTATGGGRVKAVSLSRQRITSYPTPQIPSFSCDLGSGQLMSIAALLAQRLKILR